MNLAYWLARAGRAHGTRPAAGNGATVAADYATLAERAARLAGGLAAVGLKPGDRVGIVAKNSVEYLVALYGIWHGGFAAVPANAKLHGAELGYMLEQSGARVCLVSADLEATVAAHAPPTLERLVTIGKTEWTALLAADAIDVVPRAPDDLAWLFYTSGTTGRPKGAMLTHRNLVAASYAYATEVDPIAAGEPILHAAPMSHGSGIYIMAHVMKLGVNVVPESGGFDPAEIFALWDRWPRTSMFAAPTMVKRLVESPAPANPEALRTLVYGGGPMYVEDARAALDRFGPRLAQIYGQGESPMTITTLSKEEIGDRAHPRWLARLGSAGRAYGVVEVRVVDGEDRDVPAGETGEIVCRGDTVMPGYWNNPEATARTLAVGWLHTGDVGAFDDDGYLTLKDRSKDLIISGGSNVYPREVEEVLLEHPDVREVSVIGRPDREWGEVVVAYVVGAVKSADLDALCLSKIARFKRPKDYIFLDALPKNNYGKVLKTELRKRDAEQTP